MTFLQPLLLLGLPLVALPVLIHLFNRMRYRTVAWGAMMFLLSATKQSTRHEKLRHILVLVCRSLAVLALLLALARPLVGGWLGWAMGATPDTVILLLDRSASMEQVDPETLLTKRTLAFRRFMEAAQVAGQGARYVLIESATLAPQEISGPDILPELRMAQPTDAAADMAAMLESAADYMSANQTGLTELWLASDLQSSNWQKANPRWDAVRERLLTMPQGARVRLLALTQPAGDNVALSLREARRQRSVKGHELLLALELTRLDTGDVTLPVSVVHEGARTAINVPVTGQRMRFEHRLDLGERSKSGWGFVELPADGNARDNRAYFVYGDEVHLASVVVGEPGVSRRLLQLASAPAPAMLNQSCKAYSASEATALQLDEAALVTWMTALPAEGVDAGWRAFVESGGVMVCYPPSGGGSGAGGALFGGTGWGEAETAPADKPWLLSAWSVEEGPLAKTRDGRELPVSELSFKRRQAIVNGGTVLATFNDGRPFLTRQRVGRGAVYFCASLPEPGWSNLDDGMVLVPMMQRLVMESGMRLGGAMLIECGEPLPGGSGAEWARVDEESGETSVGAHVAGVYRSGARLAAANRAGAEDEWDVLSEEQVLKLFGDVPVRVFEEKGGVASRMQAEVWRTFLWAMLLLLLAEAILALPNPLAPSREGSALSRAMATAATGAGKGEG